MMVEAPQSRHIVAMIAGTQMQKVLPDYLQISLLNHSQIAPPLLSFHAVRGIVSVRRSACSTSTIFKHSDLIRIPDYAQSFNCLG